MLGWVRCLLMKDFQAFLSLAMSLLTFLSLQISSDYLIQCFPWLSPCENTTNFLHLLDQALSSILSKIRDTISLQFPVFPWKFDLLQVKQNLIYCMISSVYKFSRELPNNLRFRIMKLGNENKISKLGGDTG